MLNRSGIKTASYGAPTQILANVDLQASVGCIVPQTLGEWSRECDAAGNLIFDGDYCSGAQPHVVWEVYRSGSYFLVWTDATTQELLSLVEHPWCKVVGNIHDNPRLMLDSLIGGDKDA